MNNQPQEYYTPYQLKFPIEIEKIIETNDPVYTFCEVIDHVDLNKYLTTKEPLIKVTLKSQRIQRFVNS